MDHFSRQRVIGGLAFLLLGLVLTPAVHAQTTSAQAMQACHDYNVTNNFDSAGYGSNFPASCVDSGRNPEPDITHGTVDDKTKDGNVIKGFNYDFTGPNPCSGMASLRLLQQGKIIEGSTTCVNGPRQPDGTQAMCGVSLNPHGAPTSNLNQFGRWETYVDFVPTGSVCGLGDGTGVGTVKGPTGDPQPDVPPIPDPLPPDLPVPPHICAVGSCYDQSADDFSASGDGGKASVPGSDARSPAGGCGTSGDTTVCAGTPNAPPPPPGAVPDPATAAQNNDHYDQSNPQTGQVIPVNVVVFSNTGSTSNGSTNADSTPTHQPGGAPNPGQPTPGDPAPSSSAAKPNSTFGGGLGCDSPPVCTGDAAICGISRTQYFTTCQVHKDITGNGPPATLEADKTKYSQGDVWDDTAPVGDGGQGDAANAGNYNQTGFGYADTCPMEDLPVQIMGRTLVIPMHKGCDVLGYLRFIILAFALYKAIKITAGAGEKGVS